MDLSDEQAEKVVGGVGLAGGGQGGLGGAGENGWGVEGTPSFGGGLCHAGFSIEFLEHGPVTVAHANKVGADVFCP